MRLGSDFQTETMTDPTVIAAETAAVTSPKRGSHVNHSYPVTHRSAAPDGGWGWFVVFAAFVTQVLTIGTTYTFGVLYPDLLEVFQQSESTTAWVGSIQSSLLYLTGLLGGPLIQTFGCRLVALSGAVLSCAGFTISSVAPNIFVLYLTYGAMTGIGNGLMYVTSSVIIQLYFDKRRSIATGIAVTGSGIGTLFFGFVTNLLLTRLKWHWTLVIEGGMMLLGGFCALVYRPLPDKKDEERQHLLAGAHGGVANGTYIDRREKPVAWRAFLKSLFDFSLLRCTPFLMFCINSALFSFGYHVPYAYTPERARRMYNVDAQRAALLVSLMGVANVASRPLLGWVADRNATLRFYAMVAVTIGCGLSSVMVFLMNTYSLMVLYSIMFGSFGGCWASMFPVVAVDMVGVEVVEKSIGLSLAASSVGFLISAPLSGLIISATNGNFNLPFTLIGVIQVIGGFILLFARCFPWPTDVTPGVEALPGTNPNPNTHVAYVTENSTPPTPLIADGKGRSSTSLCASGSYSANVATILPGDGILNRRPSLQPLIS